MGAMVLYIGESVTENHGVVVKYYSIGMHVWDIVDDYGALGIKVRLLPL